MSPLNGRNQEPYHAMEASVVPYIPQARAIAQCLDGDAHIFILPQWATVIVNWHCLDNSECCKILRNTVAATHVHNVKTSRSSVGKCNFLHDKASTYTANVTINTFTNWRWEALRHSPYSSDMYLGFSGLRATQEGAQRTKVYFGRRSEGLGRNILRRSVPRVQRQRNPHNGYTTGQLPHQIILEL